MQNMPYTITENYGTHLKNTGHALVWNCSVAGCSRRGSGNAHTSVQIAAARHSVTHSDAELDSTGYVVRMNWSALAAKRLAA